MHKAIKIMLVEDDPMIGDMILEDLLEAFPNGEIRVSGPATTYQEGIDLLLSDPPDIALLDISLGTGSEIISGIRLAQYINQTSAIPLVFLSGLPKESGFDLAKLTMPWAFLKKPYRPEDLISQIELLVIRQSQLRRIGLEKSPASQTASIFVVTGHGELTAIPVGDLVLLEADDKVIRSHLLSRENPVVFTSPGLKNFFDENQAALGPGFFQLSRKHVFDTRRIVAVKHNHVILPRYSPDLAPPAFFSIPIPQNGDKRKELFAKLGRED